MKKSGVITIVIITIIALIIMWGVGCYNGLVASQEEVETKLSNVHVMLERRADLVPNLVNTVKGYTAHEEKVLANITEARENLLKAKDSTSMSKANDELTDAINALMVIVENYPDLKASENFINLQDELAGTENRISVARNDYNTAVKEYNTKIKKIPNNIIASFANFSQEEYFEISSDKKEVPNVEF